MRLGDLPARVGIPLREPVDRRAHGCRKEAPGPLNGQEGPEDPLENGNLLPNPLGAGPAQGGSYPAAELGGWGGLEALTPVWGRQGL